MDVSVSDEKLAAARHAAQLVEHGMIVGLGSGSTAALVIQELGARLHGGLHFRGVPTSAASGELAGQYGIPLTTLDVDPRLDMTIDGADQVDPHLNLIKGHGGALLHEKIVAEAAARYVIVVDETKVVDRLGGIPLPIEVVQFGSTTTRRRLERMGLQTALRGGEAPFVTDSGNYILDCSAPTEMDLEDPSVANEIKRQTGVVEHGLFLGTSPVVIVGLSATEVRVLTV